MVMYRFGPARGASLAPLRVATAKKETLIGLDLLGRLGGSGQTESRGALPAADGLPGRVELGVSARNAAGTGLPVSVPLRVSPRSLRVVMAEDEALIRLDLKEMLEEEGYEVAGEAADGEKAVELASALKPDLVILDVKMPVLDGISAAERIAAQQIAAVVILTAFSQWEDPWACPEARHHPGAPTGGTPRRHPGHPGNAACQILRKSAARKNLFLCARYQW
jgi:CheY-like chemotaxis protein